MSIQMKHVSKRFGDFQALRDISLDVEPGLLTGLLGPSGGGKSTLLRIVAGLESADFGTVYIDGRDMTGVPARRRGIGFVFQHYAPFAHLTVWQNVAFGPRVARMPRDELRRRVGELLDLVGLAGLAGRYPAQLSGGQRQRMALARALAIQPRLLLLDEPFGALDATIRRQLRGWLHELHQRLHAPTTVFVTHDREEAMELAQRVAVINGGRLEQVGTPSQLYDDPANDFVMGLLGPTTRLGGLLVRPHDIEITQDRVPGTHEGMIERIVDLGPTHRIEVSLATGAGVSVLLGRAEAQQLDIGRGDVVFLRALSGTPVPRP